MNETRTPPSNPRLVSSLQSASRAVGAAIILVACLVLAEWTLDITVLKSGWLGQAAMEASTAVAFLLGGVSLWLLRKGQPYEWTRRIAQVTALTVAMLGLLTLGEYLFGWDISIDQLLFREPPLAVGTSQPGRMAFATAVSFLLLGLALLFLSSRRGHLAAHFLTLAVALGSFMAATGHVSGGKLLYGTAPFLTMELPTALALTFLCVSVLFARPDHGLMEVVTTDGSAGVMARRLLPPALIMPAVLGWLILAGRRAGLYGTEIGFSILVLSGIVFPVALIWWSARSLYRMDMERKRGERRVSDNTAQLLAVNKELEAFSYSVSHDLRAPIRAIDGFSRVLLEEYSTHLAEEGQRLLGIIRTNTKQMGRLIDDLLAFSRISRKELERSYIDMAGLARSVMYELRQLEPDRPVAVTIRPLAAAQGDHAMIRQVFANLISNALKFTRRQPTPAIEIGSHPEGNENVYFVRDNGVGFDMQYAHKLFGVFQRLHSQEDFEGSGVGLALVRRILHRHGGRVWAQGKVNEGATVYFTLPRDG